MKNWEKQLEEIIKWLCSFNYLTDDEDPFRFNSQKALKQTKQLFSQVLAAQRREWVGKLKEVPINLLYQAYANQRAGSNDRKYLKEVYEKLADIIKELAEIG